MAGITQEEQAAATTLGLSQQTWDVVSSSSVEWSTAGTWSTAGKAGEALQRKVDQEMRARPSEEKDEGPRAKTDQELVSMPTPIEPNRANSTERWRAQVARTPVAWPSVAWRGVRRARARLRGADAGACACMAFACSKSQAVSVGGVDPA